MRKNLPRTIIACTSIICVGVLELFAMKYGINGAAFMSSLAVIGGIAGYEIKARTSLPNGK